MIYCFFFLVLLARAEHTLPQERYLNSEHQIVVEGNYYPTQASTADLFDSEIAEQQGGTCHIYSTVSLYEAFCKRATGKKVKLSAEYLFYMHLRTKVGGHNGTLSLVKDSSETEITPNNDGGYPITTLNRILSGSICAENEFIYKQDFFYTVKNVSATYRKWALESAERAKNRAKSNSLFFKEENGKNAFDAQLSYCQLTSRKPFCAAIDKKALECLDCPTVTDDSGYLPTTQNADLKSCLEIAAEGREVGPFTSKTEFNRWAVALLSKGIPFVCSEPAKYILPGNHPGNHATTVIGYKALKAAKEVSFEYTLRDSNYSKPILNDQLFCEHVLYIATAKKNPQL